MTQEEVKIIRLRRKTECFEIVNRGKLWYDTLSSEQLAELRTWYHKWLDATETGILPNRPDWLDNKIEREEILL